MIKETILLLFIGHFLGDYYFQSDSLAHNQTPKKILKHSLIYALTLILMILPVFNLYVLILTLIIAMTHGLIDYGKYLYKEQNTLIYSQLIFVYLFDQALHLLVILLGGAILAMSQGEYHYISTLENIILQLQLNTEQILSWILIILVVYKPSSITIRVVLNHFEPKNKKEADPGVSNAGALIGIFERFIILLMLHAGQYSAIGFVLTAKSVARYNKISENPQFAEYYLLGTLLRSLIIILSYYLIFNLSN